MESSPLTRIVTHSPQETMKVGERIARLLPDGGVVSLVGNLGAGKTVLVKGIASALAIKDEVTSPTFTIIASYSAKPELHHVDLYRLEDEREIEDLGLEELMGPGQLTVIEWGERAEVFLPSTYIKVSIKTLGPETREVTIEGAAL